MGFGVFIHKADSIYDDSPAERYQFPSRYLNAASQCEGDWIVYLEPRRAPGARGYFGVAKVDKIVPDPTAPRMYLALIAPDSYLDFTNPVPFSTPEGITETGLLNEAGGISGRKQAAVRTLSAKDFERIVSLGLRDRDLPLPRDVQHDNQVDPLRPELDEGQQPAFVYEQERVRVPQFTSRIVRDRVFRSVVLRAYDERCAVTGLKLINGGGRAEVDAAHVRPVEHHGPDIVNNGVALSGTAHWMFDRGLITFTDDLEIVVSRHVNDRDGAQSLINRTGRLIGPSAARDRPHPAFLQWHRENCFKQ